MFVDEKGVESPHHHHHNSSKSESSKNDGKSINGSKLKSDTKKKDKGEKNVKLKKMKRNLKTDKKMARALLKMSFEFAGNPKGYKGKRHRIIIFLLHRNAIAKMLQFQDST